MSATPIDERLSPGQTALLRVAESGQSTGCTKATTMARTWRIAFSVVIEGGYSLGIACRIDPCLQAIGNSDRAKLAVNSDEAGEHATEAGKKAR